MPRASVIVVLATITINMTGVGLFWPILPDLVARLAGTGASGTALWYGAIAIVFSLMQFLFAPVLGALSDRFGRRPVLLFSLAGMGIDSILLAFAPNLAWVFVGRAIGGVLGATFSVASAAMADVTPENDRAAAFGLVGAAFGLGFIIGPLMGGLLGEIDTRLPFLCAGGLSLVNVIFGWFLLEETLPPERRSKSAPHKLNPLASFGWLAGKAAILPLAITLLVATAVERGLESIWVLFTGLQYGWGPKEAGLSLALVGACFIIVQGFLVGRIVARIGERATIGYGFALSAIMFLVLSFNQIGLVGFAGIIPHVLGWGIAGPALQSLASRAVGAEEQGRLQGSLTGINGLAAILGPASATGIFAWSTSDAAPIHFPGAFFLAGSAALMLAAYLGSRRRGL